METREILDEQEWTALTDRVMAPLPQRWIYGEAAKRIGLNTKRICIFDGANTISVAQVTLRPLFGWQTSLTTLGPLFLQDEHQRHARRLLRRALPGGLHLMSPEERHGRLRLSSAPEVVELDLSPDLVDLRAGLNAKWRNALKKAEDSGVKVRQFTPTKRALTPLLRAEKARQATGLYRALPPEYSLALHDVAPDALRLITASDAQMLFVVHGNSATYQIGHTGPEGRKINAHNLILWDAIKRLKAEGVMRLDLGTIDRAKAPGLTRFKLRTGANARQLGPATLL